MQLVDVKGLSVTGSGIIDCPLEPGRLNYKRLKRGEYPIVPAKQCRW